MRRKPLIVIAVVLLNFSVGCSTLGRVVYRIDIDQGNYFTPDDILKIHIGMTQEQVAYILGTPMMSDPFGSNIWFYVFRQQRGHKDLSQHTLTLTFNTNGILTIIDNKPFITD